MLRGTTVFVLIPAGFFQFISAHRAIKTIFLPDLTIDLIMVFDAILTGRESGQKLQCIGIRWKITFPKLNFTRFANIQEVSSVDCSNFHTFGCIFSREPRLDVLLTSKIYKQCMEIRKNTWASSSRSHMAPASSQTTSAKLGEYNLPHFNIAIHKLCKIQFRKKFFAIGFSYKH